MYEIISKYEDIALSDKDIFRLTNGQCNIEVYPNLYKYSTLDELLGPFQACILLFEAKPQYGHWVLIYKQTPDEVAFFNPYGGFPDDSLMHIDKNFRKKTNQLKPKLSELLMDSRYELSYNEFDFQVKDKNIKTCGRHCVVRLINRDLDLYEYKKYLDKLSNMLNLDYDGVVTYLTI